MPTTEPIRSSDWSRGIRPKPKVPVGPVTATVRGAFMAVPYPLELLQRRVAEQQPLRARGTTEVHLGLGGVAGAAGRGHRAEPERVVGDAVARLEVRDRSQAR